MKRPKQSQRTLAPRKLPPECPCCGVKNPWVSVRISQKSAMRNQLHELHAGVTQCRHCDVVTTTPEQDSALLADTQIAHMQWIKRSITSALKQLGLSQRGLADATNIGIATISRALRADTLIDASTEDLLLYKIKQLSEEKTRQALISLPPADFSPAKKSCNYRSDWPGEEVMHEVYV